MPNIKTIKYLTQEELKNLLKVIDNKRDKAIFLIAYRHGLRACEVGMLQLEDLDLARGRIRIARAKNSQGGEYPMQNDEVKTLKAWLRVRKNNNPILFPSRRGLPISRRTLDYMMKDYGEQASIPIDKRHFHVLKHSIATHLLDAGAELRFVQDWIGHKNIQNTVVYTHFSHRTQDEMAKRFFASPEIVRA